MASATTTTLTLAATTLTLIAVTANLTLAAVRDLNESQRVGQGAQIRSLCAFQFRHVVRQLHVDLRIALGQVAIGFEPQQPLTVIEFGLGLVERLASFDCAVNDLLCALCDRLVRGLDTIGE